MARITYQYQMRTRIVTKNIPQGSSKHTYYSREHMEQTHYMIGSVYFVSPHTGPVKKILAQIILSKAKFSFHSNLWASER